MRHRLPDQVRIRVLVRLRTYQPVIEGFRHPGAARTALWRKMSAKRLRGKGGCFGVCAKLALPLRRQGVVWRFRVAVAPAQAGGSLTLSECRRPCAGRGLFETLAPDSRSGPCLRRGDGGDAFVLTHKQAPAFAGATIGFRIVVKKAFPIRLRSASSCSMTRAASLSPISAGRGDAHQTVAGIILPEGNDKFDKFRVHGRGGQFRPSTLRTATRASTSSPNIRKLTPIRSSSRSGRPVQCVVQPHRVQ